jgi:hypothetical protein
MVLGTETWLPRCGKGVPQAALVDPGPSGQLYTTRRKDGRAVTASMEYACRPTNTQHGTQHRLPSYPPVAGTALAAALVWGSCAADAGVLCDGTHHWGSSAGGAGVLCDGAHHLGRSELPVEPCDMAHAPPSHVSSFCVMPDGGDRARSGTQARILLGRSLSGGVQGLRMPVPRQGPVCCHLLHSVCWHSHTL